MFLGCLNKPLIHQVFFVAWIWSLQGFGHDSRQEPASGLPTPTGVRHCRLQRLRIGIQPAAPAAPFSTGAGTIRSTGHHADFESGLARRNCKPENMIILNEVVMKSSRLLLTLNTTTKTTRPWIRRDFLGSLSPPRLSGRTQARHVPPGQQNSTRGKCSRQKLRKSRTA